MLPISRFNVIFQKKRLKSESFWEKFRPFADLFKSDLFVLFFNFSQLGYAIRSQEDVLSDL